MNQQKASVTMEPHAKLEILRKMFADIGSVAVAFSGGIDSVFLLTVAHDILGANCIAVTALSPAIPQREQREAEEFCKKEGIRQIEVDVSQAMRPAFLANERDRCYHCKKAVFGILLKEIEKEGFSVLAEGSNMDDLGDYRPGMKAVEELGLISPLLDVALLKKEIRLLAREMDIGVWAKPSYACLATRVGFGEPITEEALSMIEAAEDILADMGIRQYRVRKQQNTARIEVLPEDMEKVFFAREKLVKEYQALGFSFVTMDLEGFISGKMN